MPAEPYRGARWERAPSERRSHAGSGVRASWTRRRTGVRPATGCVVRLGVGELFGAGRAVGAALAVDRRRAGVRHEGGGGGLLLALGRVAVEATRHRVRRCEI